MAEDGEGQTPGQNRTDRETMFSQGSYEFQKFVFHKLIDKCVAELI